MRRVNGESRLSCGTVSMLPCLLRYQIFLGVLPPFRFCVRYTSGFRPARIDMIGIAPWGASGTCRADIVTSFPGAVVAVPVYRCAISISRLLTFVNTFFQIFLDFFRFFRERPFFSKSYVLLYHLHICVHTRMRTRAHTRAYILIVFDFLSIKWQNSDSIEQQCLTNNERK